SSMLRIEVILHVNLRGFSAARDSGVRGVVFCVPPEMAALAKCAAAVRIRMALVMVHVSDGQHDLGACHRMRLAVFGTAFRMLRSALTAVPSAFEERGAERLPFLRVRAAARVQ